ncbi:DUF596 domain-containing protein [Variovorax sp. VNK109]|uniref:DUF596 domain-containing protein n=1 Tax=Variovorax sp. VNK109 TaxID=3400919 RepID=UPI003BFF5640
MSFTFNSAISDALFKEYADDSTSGSLALLWSNVPYHWSTFEEHRDVFLWAFERLLREGRIKLHKNGVFLEGSIEEQVEAFRRAWPASEAASGYEDFYWWFFDENCPAGVAWRHVDGNYVIAD